jgi:CubicO group peptidase (beta-lactamase class C family)
VVTATAILKLVGAKKIIFRPKGKYYLKEFPYPDVTVRTLLTHRSGMRNYAYFTEKRSLGPTQNLNQSGHIDYYGH